MAKGTLRDTYVAALRHGLVDVSDADLVLGVVRRPTGGVAGVVDENEPALAPPDSLLDDVRTRTEDLKMAGLCDEGAHNAAWEETDFEARYLDHLGSDGSARAAVDRLRARLDGGEDVVLVCFENTAKKRCHRTLLADRVAGQSSAGSTESAGDAQSN